jgi:hypothetical protein
MIETLSVPEKPGKLTSRRAKGQERTTSLFDHLVGAGEHGRRHGEAERLRGPKIDD